MKPTPVRLNRTAIVPALTVVALVAGWAVARGVAVQLAIVGLASVGVIATYLAAHATWRRRVRLSEDGDTLVMTTWSGRPRAVVHRGLGSISRVAIVNGAYRDTWIVWFTYEHKPIWTALGRDWPVDDLEQFAISFGLTLGEPLGPMTPEEFAGAFPRQLAWGQIYGPGLLYGAVVMTTIVGAILLTIGAR